MPGVISVGLPDGSTRELAEGTTGLELARSIGSRLAKAAVVATVDGREVDLESPLPDGAQVAIVTGGLRRRPGGAPPLDRARHGPGRPPPLARRQVRHRAGDRERLLLRLRAAGRGPLQRRRPGPHRRGDAGDHQGGPALRPSRAHAGGGAGDLRRPALQAGDHRGRRDRRRRGGRQPARWSAPTATPTRSSTCAAGRTCPRPAAWATSSSCGWPAPTGGATRSASSCSGSTGRPGSPRRRWPPTCTSWRRPSGATTASSGPSSTSSASPRRSARASPSSTPRAGPSAG